MRLIRIGWDAAHGIKGGQHGDATPQPTQPDPAYSAACSLATALFKKHFAHLPDFASGQAVWSLCDSTAGVISQIDNMVSGLVQPPTTAPHPDSVQEDAARLDWLEQNLFHREKDEWDTKFGGYKEYNMWVLFSPKGIQGRARDIIDAAMNKGATQ